MPRQTPQVILDLPFLPPSVNSCFYTDFSHRTRHKSATYRRFLDDFGYFCHGHVVGEVEIEINLYFDTKRKNELDNRIKPVLDALVEYGMIDDDSAIMRLAVEKYYCKGKPATVISVSPFRGSAFAPARTFRSRQSSPQGGPAIAGR